MDKLAIVGVPGSIGARLATSTLFDKLGDPSLWNERYEILIRTHDGEGLADWIEPVVEANSHQVILDFSTLDSEWTVLGPTDEKLVLEAMSVGATYLALDDGLVELQVEDEVPIDVVPDTQRKEGDEVSVDVAEPTTQETPAEPVKRGRGRPRKNPLPDQAQGTPPKLATTPPPVATQLPAEPQNGATNGQVREHLIGLIQALLAEADTEKLWKFIDGARKA